jgi:hypothetical protein
MYWFTTKNNNTKFPTTKLIRQKMNNFEGK